MGTATDNKSLADAYYAMTQSPAWIDLEKFVQEERESSMKRMDCKSASDLSLGEVCEERGIRKGIYKILKYVEQKREGV